ncbi:magnesium transporter [Pseudobacteriovorax antillogorgiicola]|uniref:magnesium transporter n=1 Tax=Pseudobacteriovorax antillogorgiicola TaxID=1513793 RepID=UPI00140548CA|nr:magnesium transporter [Pseudobacteriovorax antillogorgiicola]
MNDVIERLRKARGHNISSVFLVDFDGVLQGRVYLQDLISAEGNTLLKDISKKTPWVQEMAPRDEIVEVVEKNQVPSIPVLNNDQVILGVIRYEQLVSIVHQDALDDLQKMVGVSKDEKALSTPFFSVRKRLPWLSVNHLTTFLAAFVVGVFEDTIAKITALAVLLPVVAGQSGNTGAQSQAVTMRGLALRGIRLRHKWRVMVKEGTVGLINGAVIGALCSVSVLYWSQSAALAGVIGVAMVIAMVAASLSGAAIPMILTALGQDPATSSSIVLTTITDIVGFVSFLGLATLFISQLG